MEKALIIGLTIIKCTKENGKEVYHMAKEFILVRMFIKELFLMD